MANDYRTFLCPDNPHNRQQHADLESLKQGGWRVIDAGKDPLETAPWHANAVKSTRSSA